MVADGSGNDYPRHCRWARRCGIIPAMRKIKLIVRLAILCLFGPCSLLAQAPAGKSADAAELVKQARQLNNQGKQDEALATYEQAIKLDKDSVDAHVGAGAVLDLKGEYREARKHFAKAIEIAKPEAKAAPLRNMAYSFAFENKAKDAAKYEQEVFDTRLTGRDYIGAAEIANELARIFLEAGDIKDAEKWYKTGYDTALRKADLKANELELWEFRWEHAQARIAARRGDKATAEKHVAAAKVALAKAANPDQARFFPYLTGYVALYTGDTKSAIEGLLKADQKDPFILCLLGQAYEKTGETAKAKESYQKVMESNAHNPTNAFARPIARKRLSEMK